MGMSDFPDINSVLQKPDGYGLLIDAILIISQHYIYEITIEFG